MQNLAQKYGLLDVQKYVGFFFSLRLYWHFWLWGILAPRPRIKSSLSALKGEVLTTGLPGKSHILVFYKGPYGCLIPIFSSLSPWPVLTQTTVKLNNHCWLFQKKSWWWGYYFLSTESGQIMQDFFRKLLNEVQK